MRRPARRSSRCGCSGCASRGASKPASAGRRDPRVRWAPSGLFLLCYGVFRFVVEFVRVPDDNRGYLLFDWVTMGQVLSLPMIVAGLAMLAYAYSQRQPSGNFRAA